MKKNRLIFFSIFAAYHVIVFFFTLYIRSKQADLGSLYSMLSYVPLFLWGSIIGIVLFLTDFVWSWKVSRDNNSSEESMREENNILKAKIYDLTEGKKPAAVVPPANR